ncbi:membrane associated rhomboid family serine protease [Evansella vedderi]|uniref:Membrane associated rhomboid family serine protease n=1 Tax=Evansella vedderi TaxID=38282 RepID=A0ABT9ZYT4_9BACI|nr:rhomboid family intramembrane serine protease [Evansella vedderi]MDQ0256130.1 membrane associated rhomboid family serine protease [Evansella vedderi]
MFIRNESFDTFIKSYKVVTTLVAIHLILHLWGMFFPLLGGDALYRYGVGHNFFISQGEYWRLITPIFLHGSIPHVLFNSFSLVLFGPALERMLGKGKFITAYFSAGILANIATYLLQGPFYAHLGASGAIFGLFGIYLYMVLSRRDLIDQANSQIIVTILAIGIIMTFVNPGINILGHLFGLISGAAIAPLILRNVRREHFFRQIHDTDEVTFDPNRWQKKARNKKRNKLIFSVVGVILLLLFISQFI